MQSSSMMIDGRLASASVCMLGRSVSLNDFAWMLSNGATNQMMTPKMQEECCHVATRRKAKQLSAKRYIAFMDRDSECKLSSWQQDGIMVLVPLTDDCLQKLTR